MSCVFAATGVILPFLSRWLEVERGLAGAEIGAILSLAQVARIATGPMIAFLGDGAGDRNTPLRVLALAAAAAYAAFFLLAHDFITLLLCGFVALTLTQGIVPFVEAATLRATAEGKVSYGRSRAIGSIAFIIANLAGGVLIARFGLGAVIVWVLCAYSSLVLATWTGLQPDPAPGAPEHRTARARFALVRDLLRNRRYLILIFACGLIQASHGFYYGFSTLVWRGQGIAPEMVGLLWALGVTAEVAFLWSLPRIERSVAPEALILAGAGGGVVRWTLLGFGPTGALIWPLQILHALTFAAAHVGAMRLLFREAPEASAGLAQTLYAALAGGILLGGASLLSGVLYDAIGARGYWAMAAMSAAGGALALLLLPKRSQSAPQA